MLKAIDKKLSLLVEETNRQRRGAEVIASPAAAQPAPSPEKSLVSIHCPKCGATLAQPASGYYETCPVCGFRGPFQ